MLNPEVLKCHEDLITRETYVQQGNSVARDLPRTGSETNTTIFVIYMGPSRLKCNFFVTTWHCNFKLIRYA